MKNVLILGSGRSGTSMVAGMFRESGMFMGDRLLDASAANPYGYYEDQRINELNNSLLDAMFRWPIGDWIRRRFVPRAHFSEFAYWLAAPVRVPKIRLTPELAATITTYTARRPFCYKDPRFCVTLDCWAPYLPANTKKLVVFRHPTKTVTSTLKMFENTGCVITETWAYRSWWRNYDRLLKQADENWMFIHYDQVISGKAVRPIEKFLDCKVCTSDIDESVSRSKLRPLPRHRDAQKCGDVYRQLCKSARYSSSPATCGSGIVTLV